MIFILQGLCNMWKEYLKDLDFPKHWVSSCYPNDALPSYTTDKNLLRAYHVWIDSADIEERKRNSLDIYGLEDKLAPRFHVVLHYGASENLFTSDDFNEVVGWVKNNPKTREQLLETYDWL